MKRVSDVDLRLLRIFVVVAEAKGFAAAETYLNISTSTISVHISNLESRLGIRLCERGRGGFKLTDRGRIVYEETKGLLKTLDDFAGTLTSAKSILAGRLSIGMVDALVGHPDFPISDALREFNRTENEVELELIVSTRQELEHFVIEGRLHAALGPFIRNISGLKFTPLLREPIRLYCGIGHPLYQAPRKVIAKADLSSFRTVLRQYNSEFDRSRLGVVQEEATVNKMEGMLVLLLSGGYIGYLPEHYAQPWVDAGELFEINAGDTAYVSEHALITKAGGQAAPALERFATITQSICMRAQQKHQFG
ncbi:LysR family transcriptional regulator [Tropicimonas marinistellae]|uniref:LysR family transcriptional regulator n=1 Tax=Tropicimonas marinistellae TaxID=1739787 RepID=UPI000830DB11|nr:LysR family transcriptional regulator [Tropicimonas marinistellae]